MVKKLFIAGLTPGELIADVFLLASAKLGQARNGPYWRLDLRDSSGHIEGKIWSPLSQEFTELPSGKPVRIEARVSSYKDKAELAVTGLSFFTDHELRALCMSDFIPSSIYNPQQMLEEIKNLCHNIFLHLPWKNFALSLFTDDEIVSLLLVAPAAKSMHHAYAGGLLEHTLSVSQLCLMLADHYPSIDRQTLLAGALCHDLGKIWELTSGLVVDYTDDGRLIGHIQLALEHIRPFLKKAKVEAPLMRHLEHLILSHHGALEFGSPKLPSTAEALLLHYADNIDAKMQQAASALAPLEGDVGWSGYIPSLERFFYKAPKSPARKDEPKSFDSFDTKDENKCSSQIIEENLTRVLPDSCDTGLATDSYEVSENSLEYTANESYFFDTPVFEEPLPEFSPFIPEESEVTSYEKDKSIEELANSFQGEQYFEPKEKVSAFEEKNNTVAVSNDFFKEDNSSLKKSKELPLLEQCSLLSSDDSNR